MLTRLRRLLRHSPQTPRRVTHRDQLNAAATGAPSFEPLEPRLMMSITINLAAGQLLKANGSTALATGSTLVLLADANNNHSFGDLTQATSTFLGDPGDVVLARVPTNDNLGDPGTYIDGLVLNAAAVTGMDMELVWYDKAYSLGDTGPGAGVHFGTFRTANNTVDGSTIAWVVPADGSTNALNFITVSEGGAQLNTAGIANQVTAGAAANTAPVLSAIGAKSVNELAALAFTAQATDSDTPAQSLTFSLDATSVTAGMTIDASTGAFSWTPTEAQGPGVFPVTITVTDNGTPNLSDNKTFNITVNEVNAQPTLGAISDKTIAELANLTFTASATDTDVPANSLTYSLDATSVTAGMTINPSTGAFSWTPTEAQGPGVYPVTITATDNGTPVLSDSKTFNVTVSEVNVAPVLNAVSDKSVPQGSDLTFTVTATDADVPANTLTYTLDATSLADGMTINASTGVFDWMPPGSQTPAVYPVTVTVTDNGTPVLSNAKSFNITVTAVNTKPTLSAISAKAVAELANLSFTASATDTDTPAQTLTYSLDATSLAAGMTINPSTGVFGWTPTEAQGPGVYPVTVTATDNGTPNLSDSKSFNITVSEANSAPVLTAVSDKSVPQRSDLTFTVTATDADVPANTLTYTLDVTSLAAGMTIDPTTGVFDWTPPALQTAGIYPVTVTATDNGTPVLSDAKSFNVTVIDVSLPSVTVAATDASASETGPDAGTFTVTRTGPTTAALDVTIAMSGTATNGTDYTIVTTTLTIPAGQASADVTITPIDDAEIEGTETAILTISPNAAYTVGANDSGTVNIADNDLPVITVAATDASASETGPDTGTFTVTRTGPTTAALDVTIAMSGTATNGTDYAIVSTTVTIPAGQASTEVTITPIDDVAIEGTETAILTISPNAAYTVGASSSGTVNIADNDLPVVTVAAADASASETGPDTGTFTVTRTGPTTAALDVTIAMSGTATNGTDYTTINTTVTIPAGQSSAAVTVTPIDDALIENTETAILTLAPNAAYTVGVSNSATVNIADNDQVVLPVVTVAATDASASETGPDTGTFTLTRTGPTTAALDVTIAMSGTATNGTDYTTVNTTVTIPAGQASATVTITPVDDPTIESAETAILTVRRSAGYTVGGSNSATVTIADNDAGQAPNLKVVFDVNLPVTSPMVPGDVNVLSGTATNIGLVAAPMVPVYVNIYLLPAGQNTPAIGDTPVGQARINGGALQPGGTARWSIKTLVPDTLAAGSYHFVAFADAHQVVSESDETDNFAALAPTNLVLGLGDLAGRPRVGRLVLGGITYQYTGPGSVTITPGVGGNPPSIVVNSDAAPKASLTITAPANKALAIGALAVNGSLKAIKLVNVTLQGNVSVTGVLTSFRAGAIVGAQNTLTISGTDATGKATLSFIAGDVSDLSIASPNLPINLISVAQWQDTDVTRDTITAPFEKTITSRGDFSADINATSSAAAFGLQTLMVAGMLESAIRSVDSIKSIRVGAIVDSLIFAGVMPGVTTLPTSSSVFLAGSTAAINSITATGRFNSASASFVNSIIAAPTLGTIVLDDVLTDNGGLPFGIVAQNSIKQFRRTFSPILTNQSTAGDLLVDGDFVLRIV